MVFAINDVGPIEYLCGGKNVPRSLPHAIHKNQFQTDRVPKCERSGLSEENTADFLHELGGGKDFLNGTQNF